jgi:hypothetical protein
MSSQSSPEFISLGGSGPGEFDEVGEDDTRNTKRADEYALETSA